MKLIAWLLGLWLSASVVGAQVKDFDVRREQGQLLRLQGLEEHSEWLYNQKLLGTRLDVLAMIIAADPDNESARRSLGYKPKEGGGWIAPKTPKRSSDKNPRGLLLEPERRAESMKPFYEHHFALLEEASKDPMQQSKLAADILLLDPMNARVHELMGEVLVDGVWVSKESVRIKERRALIQETLQAAMKSPSTKSQATALEAASSIEWKQIVETPLARIRGTVKADEVQTCAKQLRAVMDLFHLMFDPEAEAPTGFGVYLMKDAKEGEVFLKTLPGIDDALRAKLLEQQGLWHGHTKQIGHWSTQAEMRLDSVARLFIQQLFNDNLKITLSKPWLHEGFGMYLGDLVTGTRLTWFLPCEEASNWTGAESLRLEMLYSTDWRLLGAHFLDHPARPKVSDLVDAAGAQFSAGHLLYSYLLAAFLCEAHSSEVSSILRSVANGGRPELIFERRLKMTLPELDGHLQMWLRQYASENAGRAEAQQANSSK